MPPGRKPGSKNKQKRRVGFRAGRPVGPDCAWGITEECKFIDGLGGWDQQAKERPEAAALQRRFKLLVGYLRALNNRVIDEFDVDQARAYAEASATECMKELHARRNKQEVD